MHGFEEKFLFKNERQGLLCNLEDLENLEKSEFYIYDRKSREKLWNLSILSEIRKN